MPVRETVVEDGGESPISHRKISISASSCEGQVVTENPVRRKLPSSPTSEPKAAKHQAQILPKSQTVFPIS